ncbi:MAG TPA: tetratricopeptide repeat protein [Polyangiaceae bacterium]|nr:tetratricopeptide repeat protein [Polyangiaceae bacterium]
MKPRKSSRDLFEQAVELERGGRVPEAAALYRKLIARNAEHDRALFRLSVILLQAGAAAEAARYLERAVAVQRDEPNYLTNLGEAYRRQGKLELAAAVLAYALQVNPDFPEAHQNLALVQVQTGAEVEAERHLERFLELRPDHALGHVSLAWLLLRTQRPLQALARAERAVELAPGLAVAHRCEGDALDMLGDKVRSLASYRRALELDPADHVSHSNLIVSMLTDPRSDARAIFTEARAWSALHAEPLRAHQRPHPNPKAPERPLRLGYVSPDFRVHPVQQFLPRILEHHDRAAFELFLYSAVERPDAQTEWYRAFAGDHFRDIQRLTDVEAAELVRHDAIDLLVDLAVHSPGNRLRVFACKPAPVQITWLGYAGTTGLDSIDYRLTDPYFDPPGTELGVYSETSVSLPETFFCYDAHQPDLPAGSLPALARGFVTFGCLNSPRKVHAGAVALWARVLQKVPASRLLLYMEHFRHDEVLRTLAGAGVAAERVEFVERASRRVYLERHQRVDIALDTFPFAGGTTTLDALWMGVPAVTLTGPGALQRAGASIATNLGLPELIARSEDDFVERAVALARDWEHLGRLRETLRARLEASPLGDAPRFVRHLEATYRTLWRRYCEGHSV